MKNLAYKDSTGHITVETIGTFIPLVLLMISILSLVNIVSVQARVHYALTHAAITISIYSYALEATGFRGSQTGPGVQSSATSRDSGRVTEDLTSVFTGIGNMTGSNSSGIADSMSTIGDIVNSVKNSVTNQAFDILLQPLIRGYLSNGDMDGDEYLRRFGITNMWLETVELPNNYGNVKLTIKYEVAYTFGALPLPFGPTLNVSQTAITKGWLNGSGEGYW